MQRPAARRETSVPAAQSGDGERRRRHIREIQRAMPEGAPPSGRARRLSMAAFIVTLTLLIVVAGAIGYFLGGAPGMAVGLGIVLIAALIRAAPVLAAAIFRSKDMQAAARVVDADQPERAARDPR